MGKERDKYLHYHSKYSQEWRLWQSCRGSSKKRNLEFSITEDDIKIPEFCPYLGVRLTNILGEGKVLTNASIDRIDSSKGYTKDNIQIISLEANIIKGNSNIEILLLKRIKDLEDEIKELKKNVHPNV